MAPSTALDLPRQISIPVEGNSVDQPRFAPGGLQITGNFLFTTTGLREPRDHSATDGHGGRGVSLDAYPSLQCSDLSLAAAAPVW